MEFASGWGVIRHKDVSGIHLDLARTYLSSSKLFEWRSFVLQCAT